MKVIAKNKKAKFDFELEKTFEAGVKLTGQEVKSVKKGKVNLKDSFISIRKSGAFWIQGHISRFEKAYFYEEHNETRDRQLLLNKSEIAELRKAVDIKGYSVVPVELYINDKGFIKMKIAIARGKNKQDKRDTIKDREAQRDISRAMKDY